MDGWWFFTRPARRTSYAKSTILHLRHLHRIRRRLLLPIIFPIQLPQQLAIFQSVEVTDGRMLIGSYGDGETPEAAINAYAAEIVGKQLVLHAMSPDKRKEFYAPQTFSPEARDATR